MLVDLDGLAANIKRALKTSDSTGMAHMVDELVKYTKKLQEELRCRQLNDRPRGHDMRIPSQD